MRYMITILGFICCVTFTSCAINSDVRDDTPTVQDTTSSTASQVTVPDELAATPNATTCASLGGVCTGTGTCRAFGGTFIGGATDCKVLQGQACCRVP